MADPVSLDLARTLAAETEAAGRLAPPVVEAFRADGTFKLWVPTVYGGGGSTLAEGLEAMRTAGRADGTAGWCVMIANTTALLSARLEASVAAAIFGPDDAVCGGLAAPMGLARVHGDRATVDGRWAWGSGSSHATTMGGGVRIIDPEGEPGRLPDGGRVGFAFFPDGVDLLDTWHVAGLQGTASTDYAVDGVEIPVDHIVSMDRVGLAVDTPLYRFSTFGALALGISMVMIGMAERAVDELVLLAEKVPQGSTRGLAERAPVQLDPARADAKVKAASAYVDDEVGRAWQQVLDDGRVSDEHRVGLRSAANHAAESAIDAIDLCYTAAGGAAVYRTSALQRIFRDVHVASQHAMVAQRVYEPVGRYRFGLPTELGGL